jgi:predicted nucleic acid-binding protein
MTERLRAVFDTNVFVSALLSRNPTSPTQELLRRWREEEFVLLVSLALLIELVGSYKSAALAKIRFRNFWRRSSAWRNGWMCLWRRWFPS